MVLSPKQLRVTSKDAKHKVAIMHISNKVKESRRHRLSGCKIFHEKSNILAGPLDLRNCDQLGKHYDSTSSVLQYN